MINRKSSKYLSVSALFIIVQMTVGLSPQAFAQDIGDPKTILFKMSISARKTGFEGRKVIINLSRQAPDITHYQIFRLMPDLEKKEYPDLGRVIIKKDGWSWDYFPEKSLIVKKKVPSSNEWDILQQENLDLVMKNYYVRLNEGTPILGRRSLLVQFDPMERGTRPSRKIWIDMEKGLPLRGEVYGVDGNLYLISHFELIKYKTSFEDDTFEIKAPKARIIETDAEITERRLNGKGHSGKVTGIWEPEILPVGFVIKHLRKTKIGGSMKYQLFYSDGLSTLSFFQGGLTQRLRLHGRRTHDIMVGPWMGQLQDLGLMRVLAWNNGAGHFVLVGELALNEMIKVARSVKYNPGEKVANQ